MPDIKETSEAKTTAPTLVVVNQWNKAEDKVIAENFRADIKQLDLEKQLLGLMDSNNLPEVAKDIILNRYDGRGIKGGYVKLWMLDGTATDEQLEALTLPDFIPAEWKKAFAAIDLEHRKITPKDDKVAKQVDTGKARADGTPIMRWNADGETLFTGRVRQDVYKFVIRAIAMMDLEGKYASNIDQAIGEGYRTVNQRKTPTALRHDMVRPTPAKGKSRKVQTEDGHELSNAELDNALELWRKENPILAAEVDDSE